MKNHLQKAHRSLKEAKLLFEAGFYEASVSRLYYALFYGVSSLLFQKGLIIKSHKGVIGKFYEHFVITGRIDHKIHALLQMLFEQRQLVDYDDSFDAGKAEIESWIGEAARGIDELQRLFDEYEA